jgi:AcrR family transcriptional regulator
MELLMNDKFFALPREKQDRIINAGFHVFSRNSYKKSPVQEIAVEAGISKSLLFFYFRNKKELYLYLWRRVEELVLETLYNSDIAGTKDIFDMMYRSLKLKVTLIKDYPDIMNFSVKAYYEDDPDVRDDIRKRVNPYTNLTTNKRMPHLDPKDFKEGLDLGKMYREIYMASEGYLWQVSQQRNINADKVIRDYKEMVDFWRVLFLK